MSNVSIITVVFNNRMGLQKTLKSVVALTFPPKEVIIVDGKSSDGSLEVARSFLSKISNLQIISEPDKGIYDAMNKGLKRVDGEFVVYLNSGDEFWGEPLESCKQESMMPVIISDPQKNTKWQDWVKLGGFGYCHQGIVFPSSHAPYNIRYKLAADLDLIQRTYPEGLQALEQITSGGIAYELGGVSSQRSLFGKYETIVASWDNLKMSTFIYVCLLILVTALVPRYLKRNLMRLLRPVTLKK